jgi:hypothetical protein
VNLIRQILVKQTNDERLKYEEYLRKVEEVKFEMAERYRLHPNNYIAKKAQQNDRIGNVYLHCDNSQCVASLVALEWDERRIDTIGSNGNTGEHYYGEI